LFTDFKTFHIVAVEVEEFLEAMFFEAQGPADLAAEATEDAWVLEFGDKSADFGGELLVRAEMDVTTDAIFIKSNSIVWAEA
jgi:hypothetical protein